LSNIYTTFLIGRFLFPSLMFLLLRFDTVLILWSAFWSPYSWFLSSRGGECSDSPDVSRLFGMHAHFSQRLLPPSFLNPFRWFFKTSAVQSSAPSTATEIVFGCVFLNVLSVLASCSCYSASAV
jgi:hypothetical protein